MDLEDFKANFDLLSLCHILGGGWRETQRRAEVSPDCRTVEFSLELGESSDTMFAFSQLGRRQLRDEMRSEETLLNIKLSVRRLERDHSIDFASAWPSWCKSIRCFPCDRRLEESQRTL